MTVGELIALLNNFPRDSHVVIDTSSDYQSYDEVEKLVPGEVQHGMCGMSFTPFSEGGGFNAILLT